MPNKAPASPDAHLMRGAWEIGGDLKPGTVIGASQAAEELVPTSGASRIRLRIKASAACTLELLFLRPPGQTNKHAPAVPYEANQPSSVAVAANTETKMDVPEHFGEGQALVRVTAGLANVTMNYLDMSQV